MAEKTTETKALMDYFGRKPGQTLQDFASELRSLTPAEKRELAEGAAKALGKELE